LNYLWGAFALSEESDESFKQLIENNWPSTLQDHKDSIFLINEFFDKIIISNILDWNTCIKIERKGSSIYNEQRIRNKALNSLHVLTDKEVDNNKEVIKNRSILIFDDSIRNGNKIYEIITSILRCEPNKITVATLISRDDTLSKLKEDFPEIMFHSALEVKDNDFGAMYTKKIFPYLQCICSPLQSDHPRLIIEFLSNPDENIIMQFFSHYGEITLDNSNLLLEDYTNQIKRGLILDKTVIHQFKILNIIEKLGIIDKDNMIIKVRIYLRKNNGGTLILQPMILEGFNDNGGLLTEERIKKLDYHIKKMFLLEFLIEKFLLGYLINTNVDFSRFSVLLE
jgi:hypothetical protein